MHRECCLMRGGDIYTDRKWSRADLRVADVDPPVNLVKVFGRPAVETAIVRQQIVELLESHLEARHVGWFRSHRFHLLVVFLLHTRRPRAVWGGWGWEGAGCGRQVSLYLSEYTAHRAAQPAANATLSQGRGRFIGGPRSPVPQPRGADSSGEWGG